LAIFSEEKITPILRDALQEMLAITSLTCEGQGQLVNILGETLNLWVDRNIAKYSLLGPVQDQDHQSASAEETFGRRAASPRQ
jgi:hypothetical protein